jgi:hypothetical protein
MSGCCGALPLTRHATPRQQSPPSPRLSWDLVIASSVTLALGQTIRYYMQLFIFISSLNHLR